MSKDQTKDLIKFIKPFDKEINELVFWLREFVWDLYPTSNELIYDNYNAVAFGWSPTDKVGHTFCSIAVGRTSKNIHFGFYWGSELSDPEKLLIGNGKQYRYILVKGKNDFPKEYITKLMHEAFVNSLAKVKNRNQIMEGATITKSISGKKRELKKHTEKKKAKVLSNKKSVKN
ncbi:hypothetical protein FW778_16540 [Ginsengibacter hankyongi]|uniref:YdhG-like domain-containing protein n=1 Tax=Ginsengibacter hankyongi TaxID=2607284 RepID=A0A5J5IDK5_9BACT|nr:hypothetical protein [Ginsengibacter hankyongi]KAA9037702.1 hypothetical protein FW778_16540 [Ginsengibacter hankyongi]